MSGDDHARRRAHHEHVLGISETVSSAELDHDAIANSDYLYIEGYLATSDTGRQAAIMARQSATENNTKIALSLSDPGIVMHFRDELALMMGHRPVDLLFCNEAEALQWTNSDNLTSAIEKLKSRLTALQSHWGAGAPLFLMASTATKSPHTPLLPLIPTVLATCSPAHFSTPSPRAGSSLRRGICQPGCRQGGEPVRATLTPAATH